MPRESPPHRTRSRAPSPTWKTGRLRVRVPSALPFSPGSRHSTVVFKNTFRQAVVDGRWRFFVEQVFGRHFCANMGRQAVESALNRFRVRRPMTPAGLSLQEFLFFLRENQ